MAHGWNSDSDREAMLRRVAIVLSSLPAPTANRLLATMDEASKQAVRRSMATLADVDPLERQRALQAFRVSIQQQPINKEAAPSTSAAPSSRVMSSDRVAVTPAVSEPMVGGPAATRPASDSPLAFLSDVDDDTLLTLLTVEHPQAVALVLASIAPVQAARLLPRFHARLRSETLSRLGRLGEVPDAAASEVAEHFRARLTHLHRGHRATGRRALDAILAAMPSDMATSEANPVSTSDPMWESQTRSSSIDFPTADRPAIDLSTKLRQAVDDVHGAIDSADATHPKLGIVRDEEDASRRVQAGFKDDHRAETVDRAMIESVSVTPKSTVDDSFLDSTDSIHQHLVSLAPIELCQALGRVATRDAMLALCGLPNHVTEAALGVLPRAQAKKVRTSMNGLGSLQLREIDEAKERVARASLVESRFESIPMAA